MPNSLDIPIDELDKRIDEVHKAIEENNLQGKDGKIIRRIKVVMIVTIYIYIIIYI